jgi:hypothetical protein
MLYSLELEIFPEQETCDWMKISELQKFCSLVSLTFNRKSETFGKTSEILSD